MIRKISYALPLLLSQPVLLASSAHAVQPAAVASPLDASSLIGQWYEIASYPNFFQRGCVATTVEYGAREGGGLSLKTHCHKDTFTGELRESEGNVRIAAPGKLKVSFLWPFEGDYWVLAHSSAPICGWVLVGNPNHDYLWIYSRSPQLSEAAYAEITELAATLGYDQKQLRRTLQPAE
jgi:apolipoprotein D and lipocalin family protein